MWGDRVDDTGCVRECLRDRGPHSGRVGLWQEEEGRIGPPKIQGAAVLSSIWSEAKLRLKIARGQGFQPI